MTLDKTAASPNRPNHGTIVVMNYGLSRYV